MTTVTTAVAFMIDAHMLQILSAYVSSIGYMAETRILCADVSACAIIPTIDVVKSGFRRGKPRRWTAVVHCLPTPYHDGQYYGLYSA
ncbi:hypothetical protein GOP47_0030564 [Adiantum capillus-veneris]|nr:hypothetical protein GOP47_0030564 [Adiantum capillus-veneris]